MRCDSCGTPFTPSRFVREGKTHFSKVCGRCSPSQFKGYTSTHEFCHGQQEEPLIQIALYGCIKKEDS